MTDLKQMMHLSLMSDKYNRSLRSSVLRGIFEIDSQHEYTVYGVVVYFPGVEIEDVVGMR